MTNPHQHRTASCYGRDKLLKELQSIDFSLIETVLYLDVYPHSDKALDYYHQLKQKRCAILAEYEKTYGPITMHGNESCQSWDWINGPWPWEPDAN